MNRSLLWLSLGVAVAGCRHGQPGCPNCAAPVPIAAAPAPARAAEVAAAPAQPEVIPTTHQPAPAEPPAAPADSGRRVGRRTFRDITAHPAFAHAPDYAWLVGELRYVTLDKAWVLRYLSAEDEDRYGGSVTLLTPRPLTGYRDGQLVRVEGELVDPAAPGPRPTYRVHDIQPVGPAGEASARR
jgi:hypothetical protein